MNNSENSENNVSSNCNMNSDCIVSDNSKTLNSADENADSLLRLLGEDDRMDFSGPSDAVTGLALSDVNNTHRVLDEPMQIDEADSGNDGEIASDLCVQNVNLIDSCKLGESLIIENSLSLSSVDLNCDTSLEQVTDRLNSDLNKNSCNSCDSVDENCHLASNSSANLHVEDSPVIDGASCPADVNDSPSLSNPLCVHTACLSEVSGPAEETVTHIGSTRVHVADELSIVNGIVKPVNTGVKIGKLLIHSLLSVVHDK